TAGQQNPAQTNVRVMFEILGDGEALVDEVALRVWDPKPLPELPQPALRVDSISATAQDKLQPR
ncbi:MAG: hypothetical protein AAF745_19335, partial [Planctomycetota bacterium]